MNSQQVSFLAYSSPTHKKAISPTKLKLNKNPKDVQTYYRYKCVDVGRKTDQRFILKVDYARIVVAKQLFINTNLK